MDIYTYEDSNKPRLLMQLNLFPIFKIDYRMTIPAIMNAVVPYHIFKHEDEFMVLSGELIGVDDNDLAVDKQKWERVPLPTFIKIYTLGVKENRIDVRIPKNLLSNLEKQAFAELI